MPTSERSVTYLASQPITKIQASHNPIKWKGSKSPCICITIVLVCAAILGTTTGCNKMENQCNRACKAGRPGNQRESYPKANRAVKLDQTCHLIQSHKTQIHRALNDPLVYFGSQPFITWHGKLDDKF